MIVTALSRIYQTPLLENLSKTLKRYPDFDFGDAFSDGQILSKLWLIEELQRIEEDDLELNLGTVFILGSWYGVLPALMFDKRSRVKRIRGFDIDPACAEIAESLNKHPYVIDEWKFKATTADMYELDYERAQYTTLRSDGTEATLTDKPDTIINCACEHLTDFPRWWDRIPKGKLVALQSNNFQIPDHPNWKPSLAEFKRDVPLSTTLYEGALHLDLYERYMVIGYK